MTASDARAELIELAEKLSVPVATSLNAKAMFPYDHELAVGVPGSYSRACANQALCEADLVFFVGSHAGGQVTNFYQIPPQSTPIIQLDINPEEIGRNYPIKVGLHGDVKSSLRRMIDSAAPRARAHGMDWPCAGVGGELECQRVAARQLRDFADAPGTPLPRSVGLFAV